MDERSDFELELLAKVARGVAETTGASPDTAVKAALHLHQIGALVSARAEVPMADPPTAQELTDASTLGMIRDILSRKSVPALELVRDMAAIRRLVGMAQPNDREDPAAEFVTVEPCDVGKALFRAFGGSWSVSDFLGMVQGQDVGKRVYAQREEGSSFIRHLKVESRAQRDRRLEQEGRAMGAAQRAARGQR